MRTVVIRRSAAIHDLYVLAQRILGTAFVLDEDGTAEKRVLTVSNAELVEGNAGTQQMLRLAAHQGLVI